MPVRFKNRTKEFERALKQAIVEALEDSADRIVERARDFVPVETGNLQNSILRENPEVTSKSVSIVVGAYAENAASVEWGTGGQGEPFAPQSPLISRDWPRNPPGKKAWGPYKIRAKNVRFLRFKVHDSATGGQKEIFRKEVTHPGVRPRPFMRPALDLYRLREKKRIFEDAIRRQLSQFRL